MAAPEFHASDVRLALAQLAVWTGKAGASAELSHMIPIQRDALYLRTGRAGLADLATALAESGLGSASDLQGQSLTLRVPLVVMRGARLALGPGDRLQLDGSAGAYVLTFGQLSLQGAELAALPPAAPLAADAFRPFVAGGGMGAIDIRGSRITGLGFGSDPAFAGIAMLSPGLMPPDSPTRILDSQLDDLGGVRLAGLVGAVLAGLEITAPRALPVEAEGMRDFTLADSRVTGATQGLRITGTGSGLRVTGNHLDGAGLMIGGPLRGLVVQGNVVTGARGRGLVIGKEADCLAMTGNLVLDNGGDGVALEGLTDALIDRNVIMGNRGAGLMLTAQPSGGTILLRENRLGGNRTGLRGTGLSGLALVANDMKDQHPLMLSGDLARHVPEILRGHGDSQAGQGLLFSGQFMTPLAAPAPAPDLAACMRGES